MTCTRSAGSIEYEEIDAKDFDEWGVDYLKYDNCYSRGVPALKRYLPMAKALNNTNRDIFFSICNWG